jgi:RHS repeat-associated protein
VISSYTYTLNNAGIRTAVDEADGSHVGYGYDASYKLTSEIRSGTHAYAIAYVYDNVGNRLSQTKDGQSTTYVYNNRDQLTSETGPTGFTTYTYDHAGRMQTKTDVSGTVTYSWLDNDRMASVSGPGVLATYDYDAAGQRISETTSGSTKKYLIDYQLPYGQVVAETDGNYQLTASYVYGLDRISMTRGASTHTYVADGQGSIRGLTSSSGLVTDTYDYTAFGEELAHSGTTVNAFRYVGEQYDANSGFYNLRARLYDPANGRFTSVDPLDGKRTDPTSLHKYLYANNSPLNFSDHSGKMTMGELLEVVTVSNILASVAISTYATSTAAAAGFKIDGYLISARGDLSYSGFSGGGGADIIYDKKSGKWWVSLVLEGGLDPLSVFAKWRDGGFTVTGGPIFNMSSPSQFSPISATALWPMAVLHLMPGIGGSSGVWGAMCEFAKKATNREGWTVGFGFNTGGPAYFTVGPSYRMFSSMISYGSDFVPQDEIESGVRNLLSGVVSSVQALSTQGNNASEFANNGQCCHVDFEMR